MCSKVQNEIQARSKEASKLPQKAWQSHGKLQQGASTKHPAQVSTPCTWTSLSVLCWEFLERSLVFNQSLFSSCRTPSTHISKALTKFLGLHIFLIPNENQPGWSCEYCPGYCDFQVSGSGAAQAVGNVPVAGAELPAHRNQKSDLC